MRVKAPSACLIVLFVVNLLLVGTARTQQRGLTTGTAPATSAGRYYALVVGNNNYTALSKLTTAEADARALERLLRESYGFETRLLLNATRAQIVSALSAYRRALKEDASLLIYYAGHGYNDKETDKAYWLPVDAEYDDQANWIIADEITTSIKGVAARHVLVISDSCYSGTLTRGLSGTLPRPTEREQFVQKMAAGHSRTLIASGGNEPVADTGGGDHSVFAAALLRGLREMDKGQFTAAELYNSYVLEAVAGQAQQTPVYALLQNSGHEAGDFVFARVKAGGAPAEGAVKTPPAGVDPAQQELVFWTTIQNSTDAEDFKDYLARYPNGLFASLARRRVNALSRPAPESSPTPASPAPNPNKPKPPIKKTGLVTALKINGLTTAELVEQIDLRGVDFELTPDVELELRRVGAQDAVVAAVRRNYRKQ